jgi:hypothetical protein
MHEPAVSNFTTSLDESRSSTNEATTETYETTREMKELSDDDGGGNDYMTMGADSHAGGRDIELDYDTTASNEAVSGSEEQTRDGTCQV